MLTGVYPAFPTPFTADGLTVDLPKIKPICESLIEDGVDGFFICGTTGEGPLLSASEKIAVVEETVRVVNGRAKILVQVGCSDFPSTLQVIQYVRQSGADAISLLQPWFFKCDEPAQYNYISRVAEAVGDFPLYLYNLPGLTGNNLEPATVEQLCKKYTNIQGLKESGDPELLVRWRPYQSSTFQVVCGNDTQMLNTLRNGGVAVVASTANVIPKTFRGLLDAARDENWAEAERHQADINRYVDVIIGSNVIAHIKASLSLKGIDAGFVRPPIRDLSSAEKDVLRGKLLELGII